MNQHQKGSIGATQLVLAVILIGFAAFVIWRVSETETATNESSAAATIASDSVPLDKREDESSPQPALDAEPITENAQETTLEAVNDYAATGTATRAFNDTTFTHEVIMQAPPPADGKFYEGWLVGSSIVSTGKLVSEDENTWSLSFTSTDDLSQHTRVVITEETEADGLDGNPETHVLEGEFTN